MNFTFNIAIGSQPKKTATWSGYLPAFSGVLTV